ncbi:hypothetical protein FY034_17345 (plasmid) [Trichlorobacter lovleyi]|uniref:hypothetical protein n=1 Tax=Trichlorobacter lovleyi TaxID=313985 RepID=UPI00223EFD37|nr:hypothetical protein [Trichlorobacter lovleyi]QOX80789.1 hypothetical protein FY034_17345 [Trichlorobacter lovleyi]
MRLGFNSNIPYKGQTLHIQTEDSGRSKPVITTLLYKGGIILGSSKLQYGDALPVTDLDIMVDDLMKEQHKDMLRRLKAGEFDGRLYGQPTKKSCAAEPANSPIQVALANTRPSPTERLAEPVSLPYPSPTIDDAVRTFFGI